MTTELAVPLACLLVAINLVVAIASAVLGYLKGWRDCMREFDRAVREERPNPVDVKED